MCDTLVHVQDHKIIFAKNSDREANEEQVLEWHPAKTNADKTLKATWMEVEQVPQTLAVVLSKPRWTWGAEMGTNECGVTIGNEAVFTKEKVPRIGITGLDLVRLALERAQSAEHAISIITDLIGRYPQGGAGSPTRPGFCYFSTFLIADRSKAFVLETCGKKWAVEHVTKGRRSISNGLTIKDFAAKHSDLLNTHFSQSKKRQQATSVCAVSEPTVADIATLLQTHANGSCVPNFSWISGGLGSVCVHAGGLLAAVQATGAWVSELSPTQSKHWATATSATCLSLFKPVAVTEPTSMEGLEPGNSFWWDHDRLQRKLMQCSHDVIRSYTSELKTIQAEVFKDVSTTAEAIEIELAFRAKWIARLKQTPDNDTRPFYVRRYWKSLVNRY